jgi:hypothetical protein
VGTIIVFGLIILFYNDKKALSVVLTTFSGFAVIYAIIFEGELKRKTEKDRSHLTGTGMFLIVLYIAVSFGNGYNARNTIEENKNQSERDSISTGQIISNLKEANKKLEFQRKADSANIIELNARLARLDTTLIINAIKQLEEQRKIAEKEKVNAFVHLKTEIIFNLRQIYVNLKDSRLDSFKDTSSFIVATGFNIENIKKYQSISSNENVINNLTAISNSIQYLDESCKFILTTNGNEKIANVESFKESIIEIYNQLYIALCQILTYRTYNEFEIQKNRIDFKHITVFNLEKILDCQFTIENKTYYFDRLLEVQNLVKNKKKQKK